MSSSNDSPITAFYVIRFESDGDAARAVRPLTVFVASEGGSVRLHGPDRVIVFRRGTTLYLSPGAISLAGYLRTDASGPVLSYLHGPEITPTPGYVPTRLVSSESIDAARLPTDAVLMLGRND